MFRYLHKVSPTFFGPEKSAERLTKESHPTEVTAFPTSVADRTITSTAPSSEFPCSCLASPDTNYTQRKEKPLWRLFASLGSNNTAGFVRYHKQAWGTQSRHSCCQLSLEPEEQFHLNLKVTLETAALQVSGEQPVPIQRTPWKRERLQHVHKPQHLHKRETSQLTACKKHFIRAQTPTGVPPGWGHLYEKLPSACGAAHFTLFINSGLSLPSHDADRAIYG